MEKLLCSKQSNQRDLIDHIRDTEISLGVCETIEKLITQNNMVTVRLQMLENKLALITQGNMSMAKYSWNLKNFCAEISSLDQNSRQTS